MNSLDAFHKKWVIGKVEEEQREATGAQAKKRRAMLAKLKREMSMSERDKGGDIGFDSVRVEK